MFLEPVSLTGRSAPPPTPTNPTRLIVLALPKYAPISNVHKSPANAAIYQVVNGKRASYPIDREAASGEYVIFSSI